MSHRVRRHVLVSGRVQGVGYRFFVIDEAERLGVRGWVRNLPDGRVEAELEGDDNNVDQLLGLLRAGPRTSHVNQVVVEPLDSLSGYTEFRIR